MKACMPGRVKVLVIVLAAAVSGGCASYRMSNTMERPVGLRDLPGDAPFRIAEVAFEVTSNAAPAVIDFGYLELKDEVLRERIAGEAVARYPGSFAEEGDTLPIRVTITRHATDTTMGADGCVSCLTLTILPLRSAERIDYRVAVTPIPDKPVEGLRTIEFSHREMSWMSFFPTGWIPVPGGEGDRAWGTDAALKMREQTMVHAVVDAVVAALRRSDPAAW